LNGSQTANKRHLVDLVKRPKKATQMGGLFYELGFMAPAKELTLNTSHTKSESKMPNVRKE
jgi:hypothetical protein